MKKLGLIIGIIIVVIIFSCFRKKSKKETKEIEKLTEKKDFTKNPSFDEQLKIFESLGYKLNEGVNKELIFSEVRDNTGIKDNIEEEFKKASFSMLYNYLGWRSNKIKNYNLTENCFFFALDFFDPNSQYKWFMERMGTITNGEINFKDILISTDENKYEWISFKVNGVQKKWKLERTGYIDDSFVQRFSYLSKELNTKGKYTYFDDGGEQFVLDYATEKEQKEFNEKTELKREWLGEGNHFSEPKE